MIQSPNKNSQSNSSLFSLFSTKRNFAREATFSAKIVQQQSWKQFNFCMISRTENVAPRAKFHLVENGLYKNDQSNIFVTILWRHNRAKTW